MIITDQDKPLIERKQHPATIFIEYQGNLYTARELAKIAPNKLTHTAIRARLKKGMSVDDAVTMPEQPQRERGKLKGYLNKETKAK